MKYNRRKILKMAWERVKVIGCSLSDALKFTWKVAKTAIRVAKTSLLDRYKHLASPYGDANCSLTEVAIAKKVVAYLAI